MIRQFIVYGVASAAARLAAIVLVPLYVRVLSIEEFGELELVLAVHALMVIFGGLQTESAVMRDFYEPTHDGRHRANGWNAVVLSAVGCSFVCGAALLASMFGWLPPTVAKGEVLIPLMVLVLPAQLLGVQLVIFRCVGASWRFAVLSFGDLVLGLCLTACFVGWFGLGVPGALLGLLVGKVISVAAAWPWTFGWPSPRGWSKPSLRSMAAYGIPAVPAVFAGWVQSAGSRVTLAWTLGMTDVALAGVAIKVSAVYGIAVYSFRLAWEPRAMKQLATAVTSTPNYDRDATWYVAGMFFAAGAATILAPALTLLLASPAYALAGSLAAFFIAGQFWAGLLSITSIGIHGSRRSALLLPVTAIGALVNTIVLIALAPVIGPHAAGIGFLMGSASSAFLAARLSNQFHRTEISRRTLVVGFVATVAFSLVWSLLLNRFPDALVSVRPMLMIGGIGVLLLAGTGAVMIRFGLPHAHLREGMRILRDGSVAAWSGQ